MKNTKRKKKKPAVADRATFLLLFLELRDYQGMNVQSGEYSRSHIRWVRKSLLLNLQPVVVKLLLSCSSSELCHAAAVDRLLGDGVTR